MSLQAILEAICVSGESQVLAIEVQTQTQVEEVLAQARSEAQQLQEQAYIASSAPAAGASARILNEARLEALQILEDARETLVEATLCQVRERLAGMRMKAIYPGVLRRLTKEALAELGKSLQDTAEIWLQVDPRDRALLEGILSDMGLRLSISDELNCWGGLNAKSEDGRVVVINTLESRLERATTYLRQNLAVGFTNAAADETCLVSTMETLACGP